MRHALLLIQQCVKKNRCSGCRHAMSGPVCQELFLYEIVSEVCGIRPNGQKKKDSAESLNLC